MYAAVLVLKNAHLHTHINVELTVPDLNLILFIAQGFTNGVIADKLIMSDSTLAHHLTAIYKDTGAGTHGGLTTFGYANKFIKLVNGAAEKNWEDNTEVQWEWRQRKYGDGR